MIDELPLYAGVPSPSWLPVHEAWTHTAQAVVPDRADSFLALEAAAPRTRIEQWQRGISELFADLSPEASEPEAFTGQIETIRRGGLSVSHIVSGAQRVYREGTESRGRALDRFFLNVQLEGFGFVRDRRGETRMMVGDCVLVDPNQSYVLDFHSRFRQLCIQIPDWWLRERLGMPPEMLVGLPINLGRGAGTVLRSALQAVIDPPEEDPAHAAELAELFGDVMCRTLRIAAHEEGFSDASPAERTFFSRMQQFVSENFRDETLNPGAAAHALGCSVRYIHKVCSNHGTTFGRLVLDMRLAAAAQALATSGGRTQVSAIGYESGFSDISHFCRVFRKKFGTSPGAFRNS